MPVPPLGPPGFEPLNTLLEIIPQSGNTGLTLTPYSCRGASQSYKQIGDASNIRRTVDGRLVNTAPAWFQQYASTITCKDTEAPCLDAAFRGLIVQVNCCAEFNFPIGGTPNRPMVAGSTRTDPAAGIEWYRPSLLMMVMDIDPQFAEYEGMWTWRVDLQEIAPPASIIAMMARARIRTPWNTRA